MSDIVCVKKDNVIPPGYQLHVTTWENDGDHYQRKILSGLTEKEVRFYVDLGERFKSGSNNGMKTLGNHGHATEVLVDEVKRMLVKHPDLPTKTITMWQEAISNTEGCKDNCQDCEIDCDAKIHGILCDTLLGHTVEYDYETNFCRVFDNFEVFYVPERAENVTHKFRRR
jgi:hypothetical protein